MRLRMLALACWGLCVLLTLPSLMAQSDPLTGTWTGDWGPTPTHRNPVRLELQWDGSNLTGTVNPGPNAVQLSKAAFVAGTGDITLEAEAPHRGAMAHYAIEGKLEGDTMMGSWSHDNARGDFTLTKE